MNEKAIVIIPAFNEEAFIGRTLEILRPEIGKSISEIMVVDDGSSDKTAEIAEKRGATVLRLGRNFGKGTAFMAGVRYARQKDAPIIASIDADLYGTSALNPVRRLIEPLLENKQLQMVTARMLETTTPVKEFHMMGGSFHCSGQRAFRTSAFEPFFNGNRKWTELLNKSRFGLEKALNYLISKNRQETALVIFNTAVPYRKPLRQQQLEVNLTDLKIKAKMNIIPLRSNSFSFF